MGNEIHSTLDFHTQLSKALDVEHYYGKNLDALWDLLGFGIEIPLTINWQNSNVCKLNIGEDFDQIINVLRRVKAQNEEINWQDKFDFILQ